MFLINSLIMARIKKARGRTILDFLQSESQQEPEAQIQVQPQAQSHPYTRARAHVQVQPQPQEHIHSTGIGSQPEAFQSTQLDGTCFIFTTIGIFYNVNALSFFN